MIGKSTVYPFAAKVKRQGIQSTIRKRKANGNSATDGKKKNKLKSLSANKPLIASPGIVQTIKDAEKAETNIRTAIAGLSTAYTYFLEKCKFQVGEMKKAIIKRRCDNEGFLVEVCGKICALHVSQLFAELEDFAEPMTWFTDGQELSVFIRDVLEIEQCPFLTRVKGLSGNLIAATTLIPPDHWFTKVPTRFLVYKCASNRVSDDKMDVCLGPNLQGFIPFQNWDDKLLKYAPQMKDGSAINVYTFRLERTLSKFTNFVASRVKKIDCQKVEKGDVLPIVRINVTKFLLPCKSRFTGWKLLLPLTEADDNYSDTNRQANLVPTLGLVMAVDEKKKLAIVSTRLSRLKTAMRESTLSTLLPKGPVSIQDRGIINARLLHNKKGTVLRGFVVKEWEENRIEVLLGMDYLWPIMGHLKDESGTLHKRLKHLSVVKVRLLKDHFETQKGVLVDIDDGTSPQDDVSENGDKESDEEQSLEKKSVEMDHDSYINEIGEEEGFNWDYDAQPNLSVLAQAKTLQDSDSSSSSDEDENAAPVAKKSRKEREEDRRRKEAAMREAEKKLSKFSDSDETPKTAEDFDRLVMSKPGDASLWIRYMAHHLQQLEVEKARQVAKRGLKVIVGNEADKLSLWQACLNLENMYGTQDSLETVFKEALKQNDPLKVYTHLARIYGQSDKEELARQTYQTMLKKFKQHMEVWINFGSWLFDIGSQQEARQLMKRSFNSLTEKEHVELIVKFAQFEFAKGEADFGKSLMDNLLLSYPKRLDLWNVYIDILIKLKDFDAVRINFNKLLSAKLTLRKMKSVFKKWIDFETKHGTPDLVEEVKQKVVAYVDLDRS